MANPVINSNCGDSSIIHYGSFLRGTPITKIDGHNIPIEKVKRGDLLRGIGPEGESNTSQVLVIARDFCTSYLKITTEDTQLNVSGKHRIYVGPDVPSDAECPHFVKANTLKVNDYIYFEAKKSKIIDITEIHERTEVFNLKCDRPGVAATHDDEDCWATFHAAGIAVHEMGACAPIGITHIIPNCGPPGTLVTIIARNDGAVHAYEGFDGFYGNGDCGCATFCNPGYVTGVTFGGNAATVLGSSRFVCHAIAPQGSGTVVIAATTDWSGNTLAFEPGSNEFTYNNFCGYGYGTSYPHQKHGTGKTNSPIPHDKPINQWTTGKGIGMRRRNFSVPPPPPPPPPPPFGYNGNTHQRHDTGQTNYSIPHTNPLNQWTSGKGIGFRRKPILASMFPPPPELTCVSQQTLVSVSGYIPSATGSVTIPPGVYQVLVQCCGAGGVGGTGGGVAGYGGGGGGYASSLLSVVPGQTISYNVSDISTEFGGVYAEAGSGSTGGNSNVGDYTVDGADGEEPITTGNGATGAAGACGGAGGAGGTSFVDDGDPGGNYGGGGGGGWGNGELGSEGGIGGDGLLIVTSCVPFGYNNNFHRFHDTGPTNNSIPHNNPINQFTTGQGIGLRRKSSLGAAAAGPLPPPPEPQPACYRTGSATFVGTFEPFSTSFQVPDGVYSVFIECQGAGGDGSLGGDGDTISPGQGGGAGAYAASTIAVTPGDSFAIYCDGPNGGSGSDAVGPSTVNAASALNNSGGLASSSTGDVTIDGQDGYVGEVFPGSGRGGQGGNAQFGTGGLGGSGHNYTGDDGDPGLPGNFYGSGGGGGGWGGSNGGAGGVSAPGLVRITWCWYFGYGPPVPPHQQHDTGPTSNPITHDTPLNNNTTTKGIGMRRKYILATAVFAVPPPPPVPPSPPFCGRMTTFILDGPATVNFTIPAGVTSIYVECVGGGDNGEDGSTLSGFGGGGGGYGSSLISVLPGNTYAIIAGDTAEVSSFDGGVVQGDAGVGQTGGISNNGNFTQNGQDGANGGTASSGGDGGGSGSGAVGGLGGASDSNGLPGGLYGGGGGGGGGSASPDSEGGVGAVGQVRITWISDYGYLGDFHQNHSTGQTNYSILHCTPLNQYTTTKGIGMRRKYILAAAMIEELPAPSSLITVRSCVGCYI